MQTQLCHCKKTTKNIERTHSHSSCLQELYVVKSRRLHNFKSHRFHNFFRDGMNFFSIILFSFFVVAVGADDRPNIVFLLTDDQSTFSVGCYGNPDVKTPNIDGLARDGMAFDNHYVTTAICMASRANIMTGKYEFRNGCNFGHGKMLPEHWENSYPMLLRKSGYLTAMAGKFGFRVSGQPYGMPIKDFDWWGAEEGQTSYVTNENESMKAYAEKYPHSTRSYGAFGADFIAEAASGNKPFSLSISFKAPHRPSKPDPLDDHVYANATFSKPGNLGLNSGKHFSKQSRQGRQVEQFHDWEYEDNYNEVMAKYHQQVYAVDVAVGMVREALEEHGVANNTVIIFTSDNGFMCGSHGFGGKVLPYAESSLVPLIMYDPRHRNSGKQLRSSALTGNVDFAPTMFELAGIGNPGGMDGKSLMPLYDYPRGRTHMALPLINVWGEEKAYSLAVVTKYDKYINWPWAGEGFNATEELYKLKYDPMELSNHVERRNRQRVLAKMRRLYDGFVRQWQTHAVPYHNYSAFSVFFNREVAWENKLAAFDSLLF